MPRELYLVSPRPVIIEALVVAAARVDDQLALRALYNGAALQLVDEAEVAVLTLENSRLLVDASDAAWCAPGLFAAGSSPGFRSASDGNPSGGRGGSSPHTETDRVSGAPATGTPRGVRGVAPPHGADTWWTEATAPWGGSGDPGVAVLRELAEILDGRLTVEDGR